MNMILSGLRVVEHSAFVAAPLCGMTLAQQGAEVIRFDPPEGGLDARRWPLSADGKSLYWVGLNKGKRSIVIDTRTEEGRELAINLITAHGEGAGIFLTNFPARGWRSYDSLKQRREDLIMMNILGSPDGSPAVDYTVNCAVGIPFATGPSHGEAAVNPVNNVLPAWDLVTGISAAFAIVSAERKRRMTGAGQSIRIALSDVAMAMVGNLGYIAEAQVNHQPHFSYGNYLYGAYGHEFETKDRRLIYLVAITKSQWRAVLKVTGLGGKMQMLEEVFGVSLEDEGGRFKARDGITALLEPWIAARTLAEIRDEFDGSGVCWGPYQTFLQMVEEDPRCSTENPMFAEIEQPGIGPFLVPGSPLSFSGEPRQAPRPAPILGEHTDQVLSGVLGMSDGQIGTLRDKRIVAGPIEL